MLVFLPPLQNFPNLDVYFAGQWGELTGLQVVLLENTSRWGWRTRTEQFMAASTSNSEVPLSLPTPASGALVGLSTCELQRREVSEH